ncbi:hypothetical protein PtA15_7A366 [Puccinia triticina]|nr:uncharacterized protein PtA15_7A366 [Puccinia triticina]WAQ86639.1 hypothetical protein PtA15_7A366 [Puccinia triticina]
MDPALDVAGSSSSYTAAAAFNLKYWISPPESPKVREQVVGFLKRCAEFQGPRLELNTKEPKNADMNALIDYYENVIIQESDLDKNDPRRLFIEHMRDETFEPEYAAYLIQFGFMSILHNRPLAEDERVKEWLKILAYTLREAKHARSFVVSHLAVSASYGLLSLKLRYRNLERRLPDISAMIECVDYIHGAITVDEANFLRWEHEFIFRGRFGREIIDPVKFTQIVELDKHLENAMTSPTPENGWKYLKKLCEEFGSSSAHRRLIWSSTS